MSLTHSPSSTSRSGIVGFGSKEPHSPYLPYVSNTELPDFADTRQPHNVTTVVVRPRKSRFEGLANAYSGVSWILGFREKYSLALCECDAFYEPATLIFTKCSDIFRGCSYRLLFSPHYDDEPSKCT